MAVDTDKIYSPIFGTRYADTITGTSRSEVISGLQGDDVLSAQNGDDLIYGGGGDDIITGNSGKDILYGGGGPLYADLSAFNVTQDYDGRITFLDEGAGYRNTLGMYKIAEDGSLYDADILFPNSSKAGSGGDLTPGESYVDIALEAGDQLGFFVLSNAYGKGADNQAMLADEAADFVLRNANGDVANLLTDSNIHLWHVDADSGVETKVQTHYGYDIFHSAADPDADYAPNPDNFDHTVGKLNTVTGEVILGFEDLKYGGDKDYDDVVFRFDIGVTNAAALVPVKGTPEPGSDDDHISGGNGKDEIYGMAGDDILYGGNGYDLVWGNSGDDILYGGAGFDELRGGKGDDVIYDGTGADIVYGNSGDDLLYAGRGADAYYGGSGFDTIDLSAANRFVKVDFHGHTINGMGHDTVWGVEGAVGSDYDDIFKGDKRDNIFEGGAGDDVFRGLGGEDIFTGGAGDDTYFWRAKDIVASDGTLLGVDEVTDFSDGDRLDFSSLVNIPDDGAVEDYVLMRSEDGHSIVSVDIGDNGFVDVAFLIDQSELSVLDMVDDGSIII